MSDPSAAPNSAADSPEPSPVDTAPIPELVRLGEQLRQARESQGLGLEELAGRLHIGHDQLLALERGDRANLPEAVFVIAQAKRVASVLGIDVDGTIAQVRQGRLMQPAGRRALPPPPASSGSLPPTRPLAGNPPVAGRLPLVPLLAALAALAAAFGLLRAARQAGGTAPAPAGPGTGALRSPPPPAATGTVSPAIPSGSVLVLRASEASWLEVRTLSGQRLFEGTLEGEKRFPLGPGLEVRAGRPYAVTARVGDQPARVLGKVDDLVWRRFLTPKPDPGPVAPPSPPPGTPPPGPAP